MTPVMIVTMMSVLIGFLFFGASFAAMSYGKPKKLVWTLFIMAIVCMTIIPVTAAVGWAAVNR